MFISVVVPVCNAGKYLNKCIRSILNQTFINYELLLIDDGSSDESSETCDIFAKIDKRIRVIHKQHEGLIAARRTGLKLARGEFVSWVDADDWVGENFLYNLVHLQKKQNVDVVAVGSFYTIGNMERKEINNIPSGKYEINDVMTKALYAGHFYEYGITPNIVTKLFRIGALRAAIEEVDRLITIGEDAAITYTALKHCETIYISELSDYHYVQHKDSMTKTVAEDESEKIDRLINCLKKNMSYEDELVQRSINIYEKYLRFSRAISTLDRDGKILLPYGGFDSGESIILYGAGGTGQSIYNYLQNNGRLTIVAWVDKQYEKYQADGLPVESLSSVGTILYKSDFKIIIAVAFEKIAFQIREELIYQGITNDRITWLSSAFLEGK